MLYKLFVIAQRITSKLPIAYEMVWKVRYELSHIRGTTYTEPEPVSSRRELKTIFSSYHELKIWGNDESVSGLGSSLQYTRSIRNALPKLFRKYNVRSVLDAPCGDFHWMKDVNFDPPILYVGGDIVEKLIQTNSAYASATRQFISINITEDQLPVVDLWLCRDCMMHFSHETIFRTINNYLKSRIPFLLLTNYNCSRVNKEINDGSYWPLNFHQRPFFFPPAIEYIRDYVYPHEPRWLGLWSRDQLVHWSAHGARHH